MLRGICRRKRGHVAVSGARAAGAGRRCLAILALCAALAAPAAAADNAAAALEAAGWSERSPGLLSSLPARTADVRAGGIGGEFTLAPGTALAWERRFGDAAGAGTFLEIDMLSEGANALSDDYRPGGARFPVSVTAVFGRDSLSLGARRRILDFFGSLWHGFRPGGIRLTYAYGNFAPVGSMYRLGEEETVFILGAEEERGKRIVVRRDVVADFRAAYGRDPRGPVTRLVVSASRGSGEKGTIRAGMGIGLPGK